MTYSNSSQIYPAHTAGASFPTLHPDLTLGFSQAHLLPQSTPLCKSSGARADLIAFDNTIIGDREAPGYVNRDGETRDLLDVTIIGPAEMGHREWIEMC